MRALIKKELSQLRGFFLAIAILSAISILTGLFAQAAGMTPSLELQNDLQGSVLFEAIFVLAAALRSVPDEFRGGQIAFLDALPLSRAELFIAKAVAMIVLIAALLTVNLGERSLELFMRSATIPEIGGALASSAIIEATVCFGAAGVGFLLSWTGPLAWFLIALAIFFIEIARWFIPGLTEISMEALNPVYFEPDALVFPQRFVSFWSWVGILMFVGGGLLFRAPGDLFGRLQTTGSRRLGAIAGFGLAGFVIFIALLTALFGHDRLLRKTRGATRMAEKSRFVFSYAEAQAEDAERLIAEAEAIDGRVRALFSGVERPRLIVELTKPGKTHLGDFSQGKIRVPPGADSLRIFTHELTHAYAWVLAGDDHPEWWRFFSEGLATWAEGQAGAGEEEIRKQHVHAGLLWRANHHAFATLADDLLHRAKFDAAESYPLGLVFVEALVVAGGREINSCILRELRRQASDAGAALALWIGVTRACGLDLSEVVDEYEGLLRRYAENAGELPRLTGGRPVLWDDRPAIDVWSPLPPKYCRFRSGEKDPLERYESVEVSTGGYCTAPPTMAADSDLEYQLGVVVEAAGGVFFDQWISRPIPRAPPCTTIACLEANDLVDPWDSTVAPSAPREFGIPWGHESISAAAFSPDLTLLATGGREGGGRIWEVASGKLLAVFPSAKRIRRLEFSAHGRLLLVEAEDAVQLRESTSGRLIWQLYQDRLRAVFHPRLDAVLLTGGRRLWVLGATSGERFADLPLEGAELLAMHPDGRRLIVASRSALESLELDTGARDRIAELEVRPISLAIAPGGKRAAIADVKGVLHLYDLDTRRELPLEDRGDPSPSVGALSFAPSGRLFWTRDDLAFALGEDGVSEQVMRDRKYSEIVFAPDGRVFGADDFTGLGYLFDAAGRELRRFGGLGARTDSLQLAGDRLVAFRTWRHLIFFDPIACAPARKVPIEFLDPIAVSPDGKAAAVLDAKGAISVFEVATRRARAYRLPDRAIRVGSMVFSADKSRLVIGARDHGLLSLELASGRFAIWDEEKGPENIIVRDDRVFWLAEGLRTATISADNRAFIRRPTNEYHRTLAVDDTEEIAYLGDWNGIDTIDVETSRPLFERDGFEGGIEQMVIAGNRLFVITERGFLYRSPARPPWSELALLSQVHAGAPTGLVHLAASERLVSTGRDGLLAVYDLAEDRLVCGALFDLDGEHTVLPRIPFQTER